MLVAGVDVGNSTTEVAVARVEPGGEPEWLLVLRRPTTGPKGSPACAEGISDLIGQAERRLGERPHLLLLAELHPVESSLVELGMLEELDLARTAIARPASSTPSGNGVAVGVLRTLGELTGQPDGRAVLVVVVGLGLRRCGRVPARREGPRLDDRGGDRPGGRRRPDREPIRSRHPDRGRGRRRRRAASRIAGGGRGSTARRERPRARRSAASRGSARALAGRGPRGTPRRPRGRRSPGGDRLPRGGGREPARARRAARRHARRCGRQRRPLDERAPVPPPGSVRAVRGAAGDRDGLLDLFCVRASRAAGRPGLRPAACATAGRCRRSARRRTSPAACSPSSASSRCRRRPSGRARVRGGGAAARRPLREQATRPFVLDLGGGTVDLHRELGPAEQVVATAGAGDLVTRICAALLGCDLALAERAKRARSARVETPFTLHHEDGSRSFLGEPAPPGTARPALPPRRAGALAARRAAGAGGLARPARGGQARRDRAQRQAGDRGGRRTCRAASS